MTMQLESEFVSKQNFLNFCKERNYCIVDQFEGYHNKEQQHSHDFLIEINGSLRSVSLKSPGGLFTKNNLGAGVRAASKWCTNCEFLEKIKKAAAESKRNARSLPFDRWEQSCNIEKDKFFVINPFLQIYMKIWSNKEQRVNFLRYLNSLQSDLLWCDGKFLDFEKIIGDSPKRIHSKSILLGTVEARFKSEGGRVLSSIKINVQ